MIIKNRELVDSVEALKKLNTCTKLNIKVAHRIALNCMNIDKCIEIYSALYKRIFDKYKTIEDDKEVIKGDNIQKFTTELEELLNEEIEIAIKKIKIDELDGAELSPSDIRFISYMIFDEEEQ